MSGFLVTLRIPTDSHIGGCFLSALIVKCQFFWACGFEMGKTHPHPKTMALPKECEYERRKPANAVRWYRLRSDFVDRRGCDTSEEKRLTMRAREAIILAREVT
jgi:hypothetical protein